MILLSVDKMSRSPLEYEDLNPYAGRWEHAKAEFGNFLGFGSGSLLDEGRLNQRVIDEESRRAGFEPGEVRRPTAGTYAARGAGAYDDLYADLVKIREANPMLDREALRKVFPDYPPELAENVSEVRAGMLLEAYRERQAREEIISRAKPDWKSTTITFGAGLAAGALDPVNYIPFAGQAARIGQSVKLLSRAGLGVVARGYGRGALEGMIGNAVVDAMAYPYLNSIGADLGAGDFAADVAFGGLLGGFFGGAGRLLAQRKFNVNQAALAQAIVNIENGEPVNAARIFKDAGVSYTEAVNNNPLFRGEVDRLTEELDRGGGIEGDMARAQAELAGRMAWVHAENTGDDPVGILAGLRIEAAAHLEHSPDALNMARKFINDPACPAMTTLEDFFSYSTGASTEPAFFRLGKIDDAHGVVSKLKDKNFPRRYQNFNLELPDDVMGRHVVNRHPDIKVADWKQARQVVYSADEVFYLGLDEAKRATFGFIKKDVDGKHGRAVIGYLTGNKEQGPRMFVKTYYKDVFEKIKKKLVRDESGRMQKGMVTHRRAEGLSAYPDSGNKPESLPGEEPGNSAMRSPSTEKLPGKTPAAPPVEPKPVEGRDASLASATSSKRIAPFSGDVNDDILGQAILEQSGALIRLLNGAGPEVGLHELVHVARKFLKTMAASENASPELKKAWAGLEVHFGLKPGGELSREAEEAFAELGLKYFRDDAIVPEGLERPLAQVRRMLAEAYDVGSSVGRLDLPDDARGLFDRIIAKEEEARALRDERAYSARPDDDEAAHMTSEEMNAAKRSEVEGFIGELEARRELGLDLDPEERAVLSALEEEKIKAEAESEKLNMALDCVVKNGGE